MKNLKKPIILVILVLLLIGFAAFIHHKYTSEIDNLKVSLKKELIKNDSLKKVADGFYTKLVADTLTKRELRRLNDSLKLELKTPKIITQIVFVPKEQETEIVEIEKDSTTLKLTDYYPDKDNPFIIYKSLIDLENKTGIGNFTFNSVKIDLGIGENPDGTFTINTKLPEFLEIASLDVSSQPITPTKVKNFGFLLGTGIGNNFRDDSPYMKLSTGVRYKKLYLDIQTGTNETAEVIIKYEF